MHAREHHLLEAALAQHFQLRQYVTRRHAPAATARHRHDAEGAEQVAPLLDLQEGARLPREAVGAERLHLARAPQIVDQHTISEPAELTAHGPYQIRQSVPTDDVI